MLTPFDIPTKPSPYDDNYPTEEQEREQQEAILKSEYGTDYEEDKIVTRQRIVDCLNALKDRDNENNF